MGKGFSCASSWLWMHLPELSCLAKPTGFCFLPLCRPRLSLYSSGFRAEYPHMIPSAVSYVCSVLRLMPSFLCSTSHLHFLAPWPQIQPGAPFPKVGGCKPRSQGDLKKQKPSLKSAICFGPPYHKQPQQWEGQLLPPCSPVPVSSHIAHSTGGPGDLCPFATHR